MRFRPGKASETSVEHAEHVRDRLTIILAVGSGSLNVISFLGLGRVFASVITGNLVLLGIGIGKPDGTVALHAGVATLGYLVGVAAGALISGHPEDGQPPWPRRVSVALLAELALLCGLLAGWELSGAHPAGNAGLTLLSVLTAAMGLQSAAVIRLAVPGYSTTFLTSTLIRTVTELLIGPRERVAIKVAALLSLITGALAGVLLFDNTPRLAPLLALLLVAVVLVLALRLPQPRDPGGES